LSSNSSAAVGVEAVEAEEEAKAEAEAEIESESERRQFCAFKMLLDLRSKRVEGLDKEGEGEPPNEEEKLSYIEEEEGELEEDCSLTKSWFAFPPLLAGTT
jgi:hypothetical protein